MGGKMSKKPPKQKRPRMSGFVYEYILEPTRKRPRTSKSTREAKFIASLAQQGRSTTMFESDKEKEQKLDLDKPLPKWQSRWEIDMRPDPQKEKVHPIRPWKSMPIPTTEVASAKSKATPTNRRSPSLSRPAKGRRHRRDRRNSIASAKSRNTLTDIEEIEKMSIASYQVDEFKMLYKTEDTRTQRMLKLTSKLWHTEPKKHNKTWFLGLDQAHKHNQEQAVNFENMPKHPKPFTSFINVVRPLMRREGMYNQQPALEKPIASKPLAILEEE
ncbi:hypothetical protein ACF0H5_011137 [Mactra antiquata]